MDLDRALAFSRYADRALAARPALRDELVATLDTPFDWTGRAARARRAVDDGNRVGARSGDARAAPARVPAHAAARPDRARDARRSRAGDQHAGRAHAATPPSRCTRASWPPRTAGRSARKPGCRRRSSSSAWASSAARELNVSSDIDLVFAYPEEGETDGARRIANREFFDRLGRRVIAASRDVDRRRLRVPRRHAAAALRRQRAADRLVRRARALLVTQGRAWERYAWLKARPLTGERHDELAALVDAVRLPQVPRLRRLRRAARHPPPDPRAGDARATTRSDIKLGAGRHPRDRVRRAGAADRPRRARAGAADRAARSPRSTRSPQRGAIAPHAAQRAARRATRSCATLEHRLQYRDDRADAERCPPTRASAR